MPHFRPDTWRNLLKRAKFEFTEIAITSEKMIVERLMTPRWLSHEFFFQNFKIILHGWQEDNSHEPIQRIAIESKQGYIRARS